MAPKPYRVALSDYAEYSAIEKHLHVDLMVYKAISQRKVFLVVSILRLVL